jgi:putative FmdB family regulatory protein
MQPRRRHERFDRKIGRAAMPIYEFECEECGCRFDELISFDAASPPCPECGAEQARRLLSSSVGAPGRQPRGAAVRSDESRRGEREAGHQERLARDRAKRAKGKQP